MKTTVGRKSYMLSLTALLLSLLLSGCGRQECSYCGQKRFCKEFDLLGTTRYICDQCLHDPAIAVSGNVAREYSALYENGTLEYPENSPLREQPVEEPTEEENQGPTIEEIMSTPTAIPGSVPENSNSGSNPSSDNNAQTPSADTPSDDSQYNGNDQQAQDNTEPAQQEDSQPENNTPDTNSSNDNSSSDSDSMVAEDLVRDLNRRFQADGYRLAQDNDIDDAYRMMSGNNDIHIRLTPKSTGTQGKYELTVSQLDGASSSDYVKCVIRSILSYIDSEDYDGLGHEIYNNTIQNGSYTYSGVSFSYTAHTADEIERGSTNADFIIRP